MESSRRPDSPHNVILGLTGGIGIVKAPAIVSKLRDCGCRTRVIMTPAATRLASAEAFQALTGEPVGLDLTEHSDPSEIRHVAWAEWADAVLIAPATASTIAKIACGIADNLLTTLLLAATCPIMVVPAMNTNMYNNPIVQENLETLRSRGFTVMEPASGRLACGITGPGRLPEPYEIVAQFRSTILDRCNDYSLKNVRVLITAGPTVEDIDPVRFISNRSSGKMGYALAQAAYEIGADVTLVSGPVNLKPPSGVDIIRVRTALEMREAVLREAPSMQIVIGCAAVSDYRPEHVLDRKTPKSDELTVRFIRNPDIIAELGENKQFYLAGFAAQTHDVIERAREKMHKKNLDMIVANDVSGSETGMNADDNEVTILRPDGTEKRIPRASKLCVAREIMREIAADYIRSEKKEIV